MTKVINIFFIILSIFLIETTYAFEFKNPFKKSQPVEKAKMVETVEEWKSEAQNIPIEERELDKKEENNNTKQLKTNLQYYFAKYNFPQGSRELNIEDVKKNLYHHSYLVANNNFQYVAYPYYYFSPETNQISSEFYVEKLDTSKSKQKRILEYNHKQKERIPILESGIKEVYPNLFGGLTLVDWDKSSTKLLIKEKIGSTYNGIYKTNLYVHFLSDGINSKKTIKLTNLDEIIRDYFISFENTQLIKYHYDLMPMGFSEDDDNVIIVYCFVFDKNNNKVFLGSWGYNCLTNEVMLISKTDYNQNISSNGIILQHSLE